MLALIKWGGKSLEDEMKQYRHHHYYLPHCSNSLVSYFAARLIFLPISSFSQVVARFQSCSLNLIFLGEVFPRFACTWVVTINPFRHKTERKLKNIFHFLHPNMIKKKVYHSGWTSRDLRNSIFEIRNFNNCFYWINMNYLITDLLHCLLFSSILVAHTT